MDAAKVFVIGDIHGCLHMLKALMDKIAWRPETDRLIFLGDYIDRGKDSKGVVDYILGLKRLSARVECLLGNHEALFLGYLDGTDPELFFINGGTTTLNSYRAGRGNEAGDTVPADHLEFYRSLKPWVELEGYYIVHAGFRPQIQIQKQSLHDMVWIREPFIYSEYDFGKKVIFGHTPFHKPLVMENKIGLDTGAVYGNRLTCLELPELRFHSVGA
jgi:serine/threonine protein phosphatase 1